jgi:hypothetical protein
LTQWDHLLLCNAAGRRVLSVMAGVVPAIHGRILRICARIDPGIGMTDQKSETNPAASHPDSARASRSPSDRVDARLSIAERIQNDLGDPFNIIEGNRWLARQFDKISPNLFNV